MLDEDSFMAPAFVIPHIAFQSYMDFPSMMDLPEQWRQYPAVPLIFPDTTLHLRAVRVVDPSLSPRLDYLALAVQGKGSWVTRCQADRVANSVVAVMAAVQSTMVDPRQYISVPIPPTLWPAHTLDVRELVASLGLVWGATTLFDRSRPAWLSLTERTQLPALDWPAATVRFFSDPGLLRGGMYLAASIGVFCFLGDEMTMANADRDDAPATLLSQVDAETAIWLAYKAVEAIIGHMPSGRRELERKLLAEGFADFEAGWRGEPAIALAEKLITFTWDRDKRVGHGSMSRYRKQPITYFEVMDYQYLVSALIQHRAFA